METKQQLKKETLCFVEALHALLQTEEKIYQGLTDTYGEEGGEKMWYKSPVYTFLESAKKEVKILLGDSVELGLIGVLSNELKQTEEVC